MLTQPLIVARKEIRDHLRDTRSLVSSAFYALMGPLVVGMVSFATRGLKSSPVLLSMLSVFALVAAFVGGMNVAMDAIAGERERRSLLPLLMNPLLRRDVVLGKWLAISFFAVAGLVLNLLGFAIVVALSPAQLLMVTLTLMPLALFASALELLISTWCRNVKEAHTYLSLIIFLPMGLGMFLVFFPKMATAWLLLPMAGQQMLIDLLMKGGQISLLPISALVITTLASTAAFLAIAAQLLHRDDVVYGG
jgi:sodium transport system permease protein